MFRGGGKSKSFSPGNSFRDHIFTGEHSGVDSTRALKQSVLMFQELKTNNSKNWILKYSLFHKKTVSRGRGKTIAIPDDLKTLLTLK